MILKPLKSPRIINCKVCGISIDAGENGKRVYCKPCLTRKNSAYNMELYRKKLRYSKTRKQTKAEYEKRIRKQNPAIPHGRLWAKKHRTEVFARDKGCVECGVTEGLEIHHLRYENKLDAVVTLCKIHHLKIHGKSPAALVQLEEATKE